MSVPLATTEQLARREQRALIAVASALLLAIGAIYWQDVRNMVLTWSRSETFKHGFLIVPMAAYLAYARREVLRTLRIKPFPHALIGVALAAGAWLAGWSADADVVRQFAFVAMIITTVAAVFGQEVLRAYFGPLAYLLFAVPFGEILMLPLQEFTADTIVTGLNLTGIAVVRSGLYLSTAVGEFEVARACSGLRYLIASFALGTLFALLYIHTPRRRLLFITLSLIVPILANGVRAYLIVVLAHVSDLRIATGVDHFIYGWLFFGVVMFLLFWLGTKIAGTPQTADTTGDPVKQSMASGVVRSALPITAAAVIVMLLIPPVLARGIEMRETRLEVVRPALTGASPKDQSWIPAFPERLGVNVVSFERHHATIDVAIAWYGATEQGQLIRYEHRDIDARHWRERERDTVTILTAAGVHIPFVAVWLESPRTRKSRLNWYVYRIGNRFVANDYVGKAVEAWARVRGHSQPKWSIALSVETTDSSVDAVTVLGEFVRDEFMTIVQMSSVHGGAAEGRL